MKSLQKIILEQLKKPPDEQQIPSCRLEAVALSIINKAASGDLHAATFIKEITQQQADKKQAPQITVRVIGAEKMSESK